MLTRTGGICPTSPTSTTPVSWSYNLEAHLQHLRKSSLTDGIELCILDCYPSSSKMKPSLCSCFLQAACGGVWAGKGAKIDIAVKWDRARGILSISGVKKFTERNREAASLPDSLSLSIDTSTLQLCAMIRRICSARLAKLWDGLISCKWVMHERICVKAPILGIESEATRCTMLAARKMCGTKQGVRRRL